MSEMTPRLQLDLIASQALVAPVINDSLAWLDATAGIAQIASRSTTAPPAAPQDGALYIVAAAATAEWATRDGQLALYAGGWQFRQVFPGLHAFILDEDAGGRVREVKVLPDLEIENL